MSIAVVNGLAGAGGGIIAQIITYPLQTVNTRQQTERSAKKKKAGGGATDTSTLFQMLQLIQTEGWCGLYSGLKPSLVGTAASQGIYYYFYQLLKNKVEDVAVARGKKGLGDGTVGMFSWLVIAAVAGSINVLLTIPIWVLVTRMQTHTQAERKILESKRELLLKEVSRANSMEVSIIKDRLAKLHSEKPRPYGTLQAVREVYRESGIRGFWKGLVPTLIMVCNPSIQFMIYETLAKHLQSKRSGKELPKKNLTAMEMDKAQAANTATWDAFTNEVFIDICVEEVLANNRPMQCLNNKGYQNLMTKFKERTNKEYSRKQLKNHWDSLKRDYSNWKTLKLHASGLGIDPKTGSIEASDQWWAEQIKAMSQCSKFKKAPLQHEDRLDIIFDGASCTNESSLVPGADGAAHVNLEDDEGEGDEPQGEEGTTAPKKSVHVDKGKKRVGHGSPSGKRPKKTYKDVQLKRLVDIWERSHGSKNSATSVPGPVVDPVRQEISEMIDLVIEAGAEEGSDEHFYATQLLIKKEYRDVFHTLKTHQGRLAWLTRTWEEKKRR